jgi:hypothetical protein
MFYVHPCGIELAAVACRAVSLLMASLQKLGEKRRSAFSQ